MNEETKKYLLDTLIKIEFDKENYKRGEHGITEKIIEFDRGQEDVIESMVRTLNAYNEYYEILQQAKKFVKNTTKE